MIDCLVQIVDVFPAEPGGGNPAPIVIDAKDMTAEQMLSIARDHGCECGFVLPPGDNAAAQFRFRYFVPRHEMEMCGHATIGALWLLNRENRIGGERIAVETGSGLVTGQVSKDGLVHITQPEGIVEPLEDRAIRRETARVLGLPETSFLPVPVANARTSRTKTLIGLHSEAVLHGLAPDFRLIEKFCDRIGSSGLYPFAIDDRIALTFHARQFPKSSGYPEDAATGIAATALAFGARSLGLVPADAKSILVRQGEAMGRPSEMHVLFTESGEDEDVGCWLGGRVVSRVTP